MGEPAPRDFSEFRTHWRPLLAAFIGMGSALSLNSYILSIFAPYLIDAFGWSRSQWSLISSGQMLIMLCLPVAGRLTDLFGVRRVAAVGALSFPLFLVAIATMDGSIGTYAAIYFAQTMVCSTTTATVYSRVVATVFKIRRGIALGICGAAPPLIGALASPPISAFVADHGWRAGYFLVAGFCAAGAVATLLLLPPRTATADKPRLAPSPGKAGVYRAIFAMPVFWIVLTAMFLVNLPFSLATAQLKLVAQAQGLGDSTTAWIVTLFALASIAARIVSGAALDALPTHAVATINYGLPVIGLLLLASSYDSAPVVALALLLIGFSFGGEGDVLPYLVTRYFGIEIFSTVLGIYSAVVGLAMGLGNAIIAGVLKATDSYVPYLLLAAAGSLIGTGLLYLLGNRRFQPAVSAPAPAAAP